MSKSSLKKNMIYQSGYEIMVLLLPFITSPYISRVFGAQCLGVYSYTVSIAYYFQMFAMLGIKFYGNRTIAQCQNDRNKMNKTYSEILTLHITVSLISLGLYFVYCFFEKKYTLYSIIQGMVVLAGLFDVSWFFFGIEQFKITVIRSAIIKLASVVLLFLLTNTKDDFWIYVFLTAGSQLANQVVLFVMAKKYVTFKRPKYSEVLPHLKPMLILFIPVLALGIYKYTDKIMLGMFGLDTELGFYENAEKIVNIPLSVVFSFGSVMLPKMSQMVASKEGQAIQRFMRLSIKYMVGLSMGMAAGLIGISEIFAPVFWGEGFVESGVLIRVLSLSIPFSTFASIVRNQDMIPHGKDNEYCISILVGAVVNVVLNYILIPRHGAIGVSIATVTAEILVCICQLCFSRKQFAYGQYIRQTTLFLIISVFMAIAVRCIGRLLGKTIITLVIQVVFGVVLFCGCSIVFMFVTRDSDLKSIMKSKAK